MPIVALYASGLGTRGAPDLWGWKRPPGLSRVADHLEDCNRFNLVGAYENGSPSLTRLAKLLRQARVDSLEWTRAEPDAQNASQRMY